ncbi:MAG TPA: CinA family protein [Tenericutes bacterium]|nr:CinA family protein [Mycoplasmatota bacterium]
MESNNQIIKNIVKKLTKLNKTISLMESCTGGFVSSAITNIENSSIILKYSAITYSNEFKIKMGVDEKIIEKHSVYSIETAKEMSLRISEYTNSDYGIGITGKLKKQDINNPFGNDNVVYISIYDKVYNKYYTSSIEVIYNTRQLNKEYVGKVVFDMLSNII